MTGTIALHGGGEFLPGDEPFLRAILELASATDGVVRVAVVPTAAARGRPTVAAANGVDAFRRVAVAAGIQVVAETVPVVDAASAADPDLAAALAAAGLIHLPGGDPDLIPTLYPGSVAGEAIRRSPGRGAVLAGASAGAMALGSVTWTPSGLLAGLGMVPGIIVVPHADARSWSATLKRSGAGVPDELGVLGIGERTGVLIGAEGPWRIVGEGEVRWMPPAMRDPDAATVLRDGATLDAGAR